MPAARDTIEVPLRLERRIVEAIDEERLLRQRGPRIPSRQKILYELIEREYGQAEAG